MELPWKKKGFQNFSVWVEQAGDFIERVGQEYDKVIEKSEEE